MKKIILPVFFIVSFLYQSYSASATEIQGYCQGDCYIFPSCNLQAENVSESYANGIYGRVQDIIYGYLGSGRIERLFMFSSAYTRDIMSNNPSSKALKLDCSLVRNEGFSVLSIFIQDYSNAEVYLNVQYTSAFFRPNDVLKEFASSFPKEFKLPIINEYKYKPANEGFLAKNGIRLDSIFYPESLVGQMYQDLLYDLKMQDDLPTEIFDKIDKYAVRKKVENYSCLGFGAIWLSSLIAAAAIGSAAENNGKTIQEALREPAFQVTISLLGISTVGSLVSGFAAMFDRPKGAVRMLNSWLQTKK